MVETHNAEITPWIEQIKAGNVQQQQKAIQKLITLGETAISALVYVVQFVKYQEQQLVIDALRQHGKAAIDAIGAVFWESEVWEERIALAMSLSEIGGDEAMDMLLQSLKSPKKNVRREAAWALGELGDTRAAAGLVALLDDSHEDVRSYTAEALGKIGADGLPLLVKTLHDGAPQAQAAAATVLGRLRDDRATVPLMEAYRSATDAQVRYQICMALAELRDPYSVGVLIECVQEEALDEWARSSAARALGIIGDKQAVSPLLKVLFHPSQWIQGYAAQALGAIGDAAAIPHLMQLINQPNEHVKKVAQKSLREIEAKQSAL